MSRSSSGRLPSLPYACSSSNLGGASSSHGLPRVLGAHENTCISSTMCGILCVSDLTHNRYKEIFEHIIRNLKKYNNTNVDTLLFHPVLGRLESGLKEDGSNAKTGPAHLSKQGNNMVDGLDQRRAGQEGLLTPWFALVDMATLRPPSREIHHGQEYGGRAERGARLHSPATRLRRHRNRMYTTKPGCSAHGGLLEEGAAVRHKA